MRFARLASIPVCALLALASVAAPARADVAPEGMRRVHDVYIIENVRDYPGYVFFAYPVGHSMGVPDPGQAEALAEGRFEAQGKWHRPELLALPRADYDPARLTALVEADKADGGAGKVLHSQLRMQASEWVTTSSPVASLELVYRIKSIGAGRIELEKKETVSIYQDGSRHAISAADEARLAQAAAAQPGEPEPVNPFRPTPWWRHPNPLLLLAGIVSIAVLLIGFAFYARRNRQRRETR